MDVVSDGKKVPVLAQTAKSGWMYILDRVTGKPVFGVEERPVPRRRAGEKVRPRSRFP